MGNGVKPLSLAVGRTALGLTKLQGDENEH